MSTYVVPAAGYLLSDEGHAHLCRLTEHLALLVVLAKGYTPPAEGAYPPVEMFQWAAVLSSIADGLDVVLGSLEREIT